MTNCTECNTELIHEPMYKGVYGGDWITQCPVCEWYSEDDEPITRIKQGLTLEELVAHKLALNELYSKVHTICTPRGGSSDMRRITMQGNVQYVLDELLKMRRSLLTQEE